MIEVTNLTKEFKSYKKFPGFKGAIKSLFSREIIKKLAVDDISFKINSGEIVGYIGSNGAGKSTTIKMMTGILVPTSGKCTVDGIEPYKHRQQNAKKIGVVFGQRTQLWWDLPLTETFTVLKEIYQVSDNDFAERMEFINKVLGIEEFASSTVRTLSLGQRMRADLGSALLHNPKVLFLDEPTIGLDVVVKDKIREAIKEINAKYNTTVILTTHDLTDIEELCNRIIIIDSGKKIYDGTIKEIKNSYGFMRTVSIDILKNSLNKKLDFYKTFSLSDEDLKADISSSKITVSFNKQKLNVSQIISYVSENCEVVDISIKETDITDIVKNIYSNGAV